MATTPLTSGSWTVIFLNATGEAGNANARTVDMSVMKRHKMVQAKMLVTAGAVPALGIPWPDKGKFGFVRSLDNIILSNVRGKTAATTGPITASGQHVIWVMNVTGKKARAFAMASVTGTTARALRTLGSAALLSPQTLYVTAIGW